MKIVFLMNHIIMGGLEKVLVQYVCGLKEHGIEPIVFSKEKVTEPYFIKLFQENNITLIDDVFPKKHSKFFINKLISKAITLSKLRKVLNSCDYIIDFANFSFNKYIKNIHKPKIGWCHGSILVFDMMYNKYKLNIYDKIVCLTKSCQQDAIKKYPELKNKIEHLYNPIDLSDFKTKKEKHAGKPYFACIQRLNTDKDVKTIIDAFNIFSKTNKKFELHIVGDGPLMNELKEYAKSNTGIIFMGQVEKPYNIISNAKALILSSTTTIGEGLPNTLLEAHALGTLAISSDVPNGPREILLNGRAGILFKPGNAKDLANKLNKIVNNEYNTKQMIKCASQHLNRFDKEKTIQNFINLITLITKR